MNREIKFRGLRTKKDGKGWAVGSLLRSNAKTDRCYIIGWNGAKFEVIPETVGQFTGLKDNKGIDLYEGDIVSGFINGIKTGNDDTIVFEHGSFKFRNTPLAIVNFCYVLTDKYIEVIGNIHEKEVPSE